MKVGDIFKFNEKLHGANHPFVILLLDGNYVEGVALTRDNRVGNIPLKKEYFETLDDNGNEYEVQWNNTNYCNAKLDKEEAVNLSHKAGELKRDGVDLIKKYLPQWDAQKVNQLNEIKPN